MSTLSCAKYLISCSSIVLSDMILRRIHQQKDQRTSLLLFHLLFIIGCMSMAELIATNHYALKADTKNMSDSSLYNMPTRGITNKSDQRLHNLFYRKSKLESVNETSALLSGFAIVAIVELSLDSYKGQSSNDNLLICYAIISCLLVGIHLLALLMSMCILPELKSVIRQSDFWIKNENSKPLSSLNIYIEIAWVVSTGLGLFLFLIELGIIIWIKISGFSRVAAISGLVTLCLVGCPFVLFAIGFYVRVTRAKVYLHQTDLEKIERGAIARGLLLNNPAVTPTTTMELHADENQ